MENAMKRSIMQVLVKGSVEALEFYKKAFNAEVICSYLNDDGSYMHAELNVYGQVLAISEIDNDVNVGNPMMFCFHFGDGGEEKIRTAYEVLKKDAIQCTPVGPCDYSPCQFVLLDKFGVNWCLFV